MLRKRLLFLKHLTLALLALAVGLCLLELGLQVQEGYEPNASTAEEARRELITPCWRMHHVLKPLVKRLVLNPDTGAEVVFRTSSLGLRGTEVSLVRQPESLRILLLGDETVLGAVVPETETVAAQLQLLLQGQTRQKVEVINAGVPGYCPLLCQLQFQHLLSGLRPDLVLLHVDMTDIADDYHYRRHTQMSDDGPLACPHPILSAAGARPARTSFLENCRIVCRARRWVGDIPVDEGLEEDRNTIDSPEARFAWLRDNPPDWSIYLRQALLPVERMAELTARSGSRMMLCTSPLPWQISATATPDREARLKAGIRDGEVLGSRKPFEILAAAATKASVPFCDASLAFLQDAHRDTLFLRTSPQLSARGHALYAGQLARAILTHLSGPWEGPQPYSPLAPPAASGPLARGPQSQHPHSPVRPSAAYPAAGHQAAPPAQLSLDDFRTQPATPRWPGNTPARPMQPGDPVRTVDPSRTASPFRTAEDGRVLR